MRRQIYQLRVTLDGVTPAVWRRVLVPGGYTLDRVHRVIQHAMGWWDYHMHSFDIGGVQYGVPDPEQVSEPVPAGRSGRARELELEFEPEPSVVDELDTRLDSVVQVGEQFRYTYDHGDWWEHTVTVEAVWPADPDERYPVCVEGERACPPEDVGGVYGYRQLITAMREGRARPERDELRHWLGRGLDPDVFAPELATTLLRRMA